MGRAAGDDYAAVVVSVAEPVLVGAFSSSFFTRSDTWAPLLVQ
jgi:hypothetical protein